nr:polyprenyl synthetase family protein [Lachnospiraceae bacterium]
VLAGKAGIYGMVGGQCVDVMNENNPDITMEDILFIHENKTAALIEAALLCGGILAGASDADCEKLAKAGSYIGLAFQIQDDILDETATFEELGKPIGSDKDNGKVTYLSLNGMEASANKVEELTEEAIALLEVNGRRNEVLEGLLMSLVHRKS